MSEAVSKSEFARIYGVSPPYVTKLDKQGRLVKNSKGKIIVDASIAHINRTGSDALSGGKKDLEIQHTTDSARLKRAQAEEREAVAKLKQLEYEKKMGEVVYREDVVKEIEKAIKIARDKLFAMPANLAPRLAAQTDEKVVFALLMNGAENVIKELQQGLADYRCEEPSI